MYTQSYIYVFMYICTYKHFSNLLFIIFVCYYFLFYFFIKLDRFCVGAISLSPLWNISCDYSDGLYTWTLCLRASSHSPILEYFTYKILGCLLLWLSYRNVYFFVTLEYIFFIKYIYTYVCMNLYLCK